MATLERGDGNTIRYEYQPPRRGDGVTFVGVNALTGDLAMWESAVGGALRDVGHGTLWWNLRGQQGSAAAAGVDLGVDCVAADLGALLRALAPPRPVLVGLSIGGLFAARALLAGAPGHALVLLNTLRAPGPRLEWINAAVLRAMEEGGPNLLRDLYAPLLFGEDWLRANRGAALTGSDYAGVEPGSGVHRLLRDSCAADWDLPYERLTLPTLVVTGGCDCVFRVPEDVQRLFARLPDARRVDMPRAGHLIPVEQPAALAGALLDFAATL